MIVYYGTRRADTEVALRYVQLRDGRQEAAIRGPQGQSWIENSTSSWRSWSNPFHEAI